ncbi:MAG: SPOR domain-containing protein [Bacteroidales bacterium]|nr:SPOR domain-containing protein [Bacteroidales bacterium]
MNKIKLNQIGKITAAFIIYIVCSSNTGQYMKSLYDFGEFKSKSYYTSLFSKSEIVELTDADDLHIKGKSYMIKAEKSFRKADGYYKIDENYGGKTKSKALRYEKKGVKYALKAYDYYFQAVEKKFRVYSNRLSKMDNDNSKRHLKAEELSIDARSYYMTGIEIIQDARKLKGKEKVDTYEKAYKEQIKALKHQEIAFMIFMKDPEVKYDKNKDEIITGNENYDVVENIENNTNTDIENDYEPGKDPNIYISKEESIVEKLTISHSDQMLLDDARDKRGYADILMKETDNDYTKIDNIRKEAETSDDEYERNSKHKMASGLEKVLFEKMIKAANLYFEADKMKYGVYLKYLPAARNSEGFEQGQKFEDNAAKLHFKALKLYNKANFYSDHKSNKYIQLMNAVQTELTAIQEQENAYSVYFKLDVIPVEENFEVVDNANNESGKTNDNNSGNSNKLTYNYSGSFVYSKHYPDPKPIVHKSGIIFKVQIGLFKNLLPLKHYGKYSPISYDTYKNNPYMRFMLGEYRSYKSAEYVLNKLKEKGMTDPFIVSYENGKRKTANYGISKIIRDEEFEKIEAREMSYLTGEAVDFTNDNNIDFTKITETSSVNGLAYYVQLGSFSTKKNRDDFKNIQELYADHSTAVFKYLSGIYSSYFEAKKEAVKLTASGYNKAFVTAYNNGSKISLSDAGKLANNENNNIKTNKPDIYFSVQIGVFSHKLNDEELNKFKPVPEKYKIISKEKGNGLYIYYIGEYKTYNEASVVKNDIKSMGQDGFVIAFKSGEKISAKQAVELLKEKE